MSHVPACAGTTLLVVCLAGCGPAPIEAVAISSRSLARGLVAHWAFDEQSGTTVADRSGNGHDGQLTGGTWLAAGRFGGGLRLQPGDTVTIPAFPQATPDWTVSVWINLSAADVAAFTTERAVLLTAERPQMGGWEIEFDPRPGFDWLEASYYLAPPTNDYVVLDCKCIEIDRWMHWTAVFDSTNHHFSLYHGVLLADSSDAARAHPPRRARSDIGRWSQGGAFHLRRHRRLRDLVPRSERRRGRRDRRASRARLALTLRALVRSQETWPPFSGRRVLLYMGGQVARRVREPAFRLEEACSRSDPCLLQYLPPVALLGALGCTGQVALCRPGPGAWASPVRGQMLCAFVHSVASDSQNCGACGHACAIGQMCTSGQCVCSGGLLACGGQCVASNAAHCGSCDAVCGADQGCSNGSCGSCPAGEIQCTDGACVSPTGGTALHCGGCTPCPAGRDLQRRRLHLRRRTR